MISDIIPGEVVSKCGNLLQHFWKLGLVVGNPEQGAHTNLHTVTSLPFLFELPFSRRIARC